ncbi:MAG: NHLP bacteriocin export ABC transporter permease/ATPase subunit [Selenomonadaceae bacterium]|nr:NHLP bacteriocin export ABC transporter permease/ATPase subunit [Selenomonadaceae bacterium]
MNEIRLAPGERAKIQNAAYEVASGIVEVYAATGKQDSLSFRRIFLMELAQNAMVFPTMDGNFNEIVIEVFATSDVVLREVPLTRDREKILRPQMESFLCRLVGLSWLSLIAERKDDTILSWRNKTVFNNSTDIIADFFDSMEIFSMLIAVRFGSEQKRTERRIALRKHQKRLIIENGIRSLLSEEPLLADFTPQRTNIAQKAIFAVKKVAKALKMPTDSIHVGENAANSLDEVALLRRLAQKGGMQMRLVTLEDGWHKKDTGVIIGFYQRKGGEKSLAAIIPVNPERYRVYLFDRQEGFDLTDDEIGNISKDAFLVFAGFPTRALKIWDLIKFMFTRCWAADYRAIIFASLFAGLIPLVAPIITETVFEDIIPIYDRQALATVTQVMMVTAFTTAALSIVRSIAVLRISTKIELNAEAAMWGRLMSLPAKFFRRYTVGELASRMGGISVAKSLASGEFVGSIFSFVFSFWSIFLMCYYSIKLTAAALVVWAVYSIFIAFVYRRVLFFQRKIIEAGNISSGTVQQIFAGLPKFRIQGAEEEAYRLWAKTFGEHFNWSLKLRWQNNYTSIIGSIQPFVLNLILYFIAVYGIEEIGPNGQKIVGISYAQFIAFSAAYSSFNGVLNGVIGLISQYFGIQPQIENFKPILEEVPEPVNNKRDADELSGAVEVKDLTFGYEGAPMDVIHNVSFKITAGEHVAIVGPSGSGKSTLVRLLLGFEEPKKGAVLFDGNDLSDLNLPSVRSQMGVVLQNGQLMTGDIYTNIVGTRLLTQDDAWRAAEEAGIAEDIAMMPMGMQTLISEGSSNISGGQRQRIMIARALVGKPKILIFDEATSALDNRAQSTVTNSLDKLAATRIVVAHRLSTIQDCDRIIVMNKGEVAETGTFDELMEKGGLFKELVERQVA